MQETDSNNIIKNILIGLDAGSTTVKAAVITESGSFLLHRYIRHNARQAEACAALLREVFQLYPGASYRLAICGSGGRTVADLLNVPYIQEVVANSLAIKQDYPSARVAVELGGQDAKILFFYRDEKTGKPVTSDIRMNGACAGGTGAFIDEIAHLLKIPVSEFNNYAARGTTVYDISGRCGVFAKTDIQPLLNQGARKEDIALSAFHAVTKQTIGGLAQGLEITPPVLFAGGPFAFNPVLIDVFAERLELDDTGIIRPVSPETLVAYGAALSLREAYMGAGYIDAGVLAQLNEKNIPQAALGSAARFFESDGEKAEFLKRTSLCGQDARAPGGLCGQDAGTPGDRVRAYLGIDAGSTTTKFVLIDEQERVIETFYANNGGEPLDVLKKAITELAEKYENRGIPLEIIAAGTTGYGEAVFAKAIGADYHTVETVAHAAAAQKYVPDASFILDIGGQDMKAIYLNNGVVTNIILNEACSAGCGSFLESFAGSLGIPVKDIAKAAFNADNPSVLGSRCTVFMNSCIITELKNGKTTNDIMAGLCRSVIENVFTKVLRLSNFSALGPRIVVQGGTFKNDAVLRAFEQYIGREVTRAPYPGEMGAVGIALLTKKYAEGQGAGYKTTFIGLNAVKNLTYTQQSQYICRICANACSRSLITFSNGESHITGSRCERGEITGDVSDKQTREKIKAVSDKINAVPDIFKLRGELLFKEYPVSQLCDKRGITIGIPRVLEFWNSMPFWTVFWKALGFDIIISKPSTTRMFERGLPFVPSDTVCFPAKLAHGHIRDLIDKKVNRIFFPAISYMPPENTEKLSCYVCAVLKGYPLTIRYSDNPERRWGIPLDAPDFFWHSEKDRNRQLSVYMRDTFGIGENMTRRAIIQADGALLSFQDILNKETQAVIDEAEKNGTFAAVIAGRPYHNDELVNHSLSRFFTRLGIPVIPVDALPGIHKLSLRESRAEINNNFHARMLTGAIAAAMSPALEYVQIVSFGCGHDAILTDEIIRIMQEISNRAPLVLKLDESENPGPINIRVRSFIETVRTRREKNPVFHAEKLKEAYPVKFKKADRGKILLVPNVTEAFCKFLTSVLYQMGVKKAVPLPLGGRRAIELGKKYTHNDMCFPAQINIGEVLAVLERGEYDPEDVVFVHAKQFCDCRLTQYTCLVRRALDEAGYPMIPMITTDKIDLKNIHPGINLDFTFERPMLYGIVYGDIIEGLARKIRPYETNPGETNKTMNAAIDIGVEALRKSGIPGLLKAFHTAIEMMRGIKYDRSTLKPRVFVIGEFLVNYHPDSNFYIEQYLENHGMEVILPWITDLMRREYISKISEIKDYRVRYPLGETIVTFAKDVFFDYCVNQMEKAAVNHPLYEPHIPATEIAENIHHIMPKTYISGEGWLIPAEIMHHAARGVNSFLVLQPFGCLPNHICGRGVMKRLKEDFPHIHILPLDYDPDTSFANIENRLQMLIMDSSRRDAHCESAGG